MDTEKKVPKAPSQKVKLPPLKAHEIMRQQGGQTFRQWATVRPLPDGYDEVITRGPYVGTTKLSKAIQLSHFEDALSIYFGDQLKFKDADKIFPRDSRINDIQEALRVDGNTPTPKGFNGKLNAENNAQWKYYTKHNFHYHPDQDLVLTIDETPYLFQSRNYLYSPMSELELKYVKDKWKQHTAFDEKPRENFPQAPVTSVEDSYFHYIEAHIYLTTGKDGNPVWAHRGRDETFERLKLGISSSFSKALIAQINSLCPACEDRVNFNHDVGVKREAIRKAKLEAEEKAREACEAQGVFNVPQQTRPTRKRRFEQYATTIESQNSSPLQMNSPIVYGPAYSGTMDIEANDNYSILPASDGAMNIDVNNLIPGLSSNNTILDFDVRLDPVACSTPANNSTAMNSSLLEKISEAFQAPDLDEGNRKMLLAIASDISDNKFQGPVLHMNGTFSNTIDSQYPDPNETPSEQPFYPKAYEQSHGTFYAFPTQEDKPQVRFDSPDSNVFTSALTNAELDLAFKDLSHNPLLSEDMEIEQYGDVDRQFLSASNYMQEMRNPVGTTIICETGQLMQQTNQGQNQYLYPFFNLDQDEAEDQDQQQISQWKDFEDSWHTILRCLDQPSEKSHQDQEPDETKDQDGFTAYLEDELEGAFTRDRIEELTARASDKVSEQELDPQIKGLYDDEDNSSITRNNPQWHSTNPDIGYGFTMNFRDE